MRLLKDLETYSQPLTALSLRSNVSTSLRQMIWKWVITPLSATFRTHYVKFPTHWVKWQAAWSNKNLQQKKMMTRWAALISFKEGLRTDSSLHWANLPRSKLKEALRLQETSSFRNLLCQDLKPFLFWVKTPCCKMWSKTLNPWNWPLMCSNKHFSQSGPCACLRALVAKMELISHVLPLLSWSNSQTVWLISRSSSLR